MSEAEKSAGRSRNPQGDDGVLANLPRTRPQRPSRRRAEARETSAAPRTGARRADRSSEQTKPGPKSDEAAAPRARSAPAKGERRADSRRASSRRAGEPVPRQGYESESEIISGSVQPPGGAELVASAAEVVGELAKAGVSAGERLLKDLVTRLPRP